MEIIKSVIVGEKTYNIGHLQSNTGSWIVRQLLKKFKGMLKQLQEDGVEEQQAPAIVDDGDFAANLIEQLVMELDEAEFGNIQAHALKVITFTDQVNGTPFEQPICLRNGVFAVKELATDIPTINYLTSQSLAANLSAFFTPTGLKAAMQGLQVSSR